MSVPTPQYDRQQAPVHQQPFEPLPPRKPVHKRASFWIVIAIGLVSLGALGGGIAADRPGADAQVGPTAQPSEAAGGTVEAEEPADSAAVPAAETAAASAPPAAATIGQAVAVGDWTITVTGVGAPVESVGDEFLGTDAQGVFVPISLTARNDGTGAQTFFASNVMAVDDAGREFEYSSDAAIYSGDSGAAMIDEVNPGNALTGELYFDVPDGATLVELRIADGFFGAPVVISLG